MKHNFQQNTHTTPEVPESVPATIGTPASLKAFTSRMLKSAILSM